MGRCSEYIEAYIIIPRHCYPMHSAIVREYYHDQETPQSQTADKIKIKYFTDRSKAVLFLWIIHVISGVCLLCFRVRLVIVALWSPAWKELTSWLSFVMSYCEFVTLPLVS